MAKKLHILYILACGKLSLSCSIAGSFSWLLFQDSCAVIEYSPCASINFCAQILLNYVVYMQTISNICNYAHEVMYVLSFCITFSVIPVAGDRYLFT